MKARLLLSLALGGLILASLMLLSTTAAHAGCNGPNDPNPCPPNTDKEKKFKTPVPPTNTVPAPGVNPVLVIPSSTPDGAMVNPLPPPSAGDEAVAPPPNGFPWALGGGGLLLGILIGLLLPFKLGGFFDSSVGKGTPGGGDTNPATSSVDPELSPRLAALNVREAALNAREAALKAREAALKIRESP